MNQSKLFVAFQIAADASPQEVNTLIDSINKFFGRDDSDGIAPRVIADAQAAGVTQVATNVSSVAPATDIAAGNVQRDKNGMPWDERIHSSSKNFNANGTWRYRKGVDEGTKTKVEAELRAAANIAPTTTAPAAPVETPAAPVQQSLPPMPGAAAPSLPPIPGAPAVDPRYTNFVQFIAANMHSEQNPTGRITPDWLKQALTHYQVPNGDMQNLAHSPDAIPGIEAGIKQALGVA